MDCEEDHACIRDRDVDQHLRGAHAIEDMSLAALHEQHLLSWQAEESPAAQRLKGFAQNARRNVGDAAAGVVDFFSVSQIAGWRLSKVKAGAHALTVNATSESGMPRQLLVVLQLKGASTFVHGGKELRVGSGEICTGKSSAKMDHLRSHNTVNLFT